MRKWKLGIRTRKGRGRVHEKEILRNSIFEIEENGGRRSN
jgi:hypothetical protein